MLQAILLQQPEPLATIEIVKLSLQGLTLIAVVAGLFLTIRQLRILGQTYVDFHDWNRRKAAQEAIETVRTLAEDTPLLDEKFQIMTTNDTIPREQVTNACDESGAVRSALHKRLNHFEQIAIGVEQKVLDEQVIKSAYKTMFQRTIVQFKEYIVHRRNRGNRSAYLVMETLSNRWTAEEQRSQPREQTGRGA